MLFLVKGQVSYTPYMRDREKAMTELRLVEAANETEAEEKFTNHFRSKGSSNDDSYSVDSIKVDAPIV